MLTKLLSWILRPVYTAGYNAGVEAGIEQTIAAYDELIQQYRSRAA